MTKEISAGELNKVANRLEKEAGENIEMAKAMRSFANAQDTLKGLESTSEMLRDRIEKKKKDFAVEDEKLNKIEFMVISEEEKAETKIAGIRADGETLIKEETIRNRQKIEELQAGASLKVREAETKIVGYEKVVDDAEKAASIALAGKENAEREYQEFKDKILVGRT